MNEEHLIGVFRKALVAARAEVEACMGRCLAMNNDPASVRHYLDEIARCDSLLRDEKRLSALAREVLAARVRGNLGVT